MLLSSDSSAGAAVVAFLLIFGFFIFVGTVIFYVVTSFFYSKLFEKAGVEGKWRAWVPVYREMIFVKLGDLNPLWYAALVVGVLVLSVSPLGALLGLVVPAAGVYMALAAYRVQLKLGKEPLWLLLLIFLAPVWLGILALDKSRWNGNVPPAPWAKTFLADTTQWSGIPAQSTAGGYVQPGGYAPGGYAQGGYAAPSQPAAYPPPAAPPSAAGAATPPPSAPTPSAGPPQPPTPPHQPRA